MIRIAHAHDFVLAARYCRRPHLSTVVIEGFAFTDDRLGNSTEISLRDQTWPFVIKITSNVSETN